MRMTNGNTKKNNKSLRVGLLASMLIIFILASVVSILLTIVLFSVMGRAVYGNTLANGMRPQARMLAETTANLMRGNISAENFQLMIKTSETAVIVLDTEKNPFACMIPPRDIGGRIVPDGIATRSTDRDMRTRNNDFANAYIKHCREIYDAASKSSAYSEFVENNSSLGVVVAIRVVDGTEEKGVLFLIKPLHDINEIAKSLQIVLLSAYGIVTVLTLIPIYFVSRWLINPLKKLNKVAYSFSSGGYSGRVVPKGSMEIKELGGTFNELADNLQRTINDLTIERNMLSAVFEGLSEGMVAFDTDCNITKCNNAAIKLLNGKRNDDIDKLPIYGDVRSNAEKVIETGVESVAMINAGERMLRISTAPIEKEKGKVVGAVMLLMDVTEAERLEQTRRDYVANVSHELRTPLASIRGIADMLNDGLVNDEKDKLRYYGYIQKESIRLSNLINDLLELSRLQSGGVALKMRKVELYELFADVADRLNESATANGNKIVVDLPEDKYYAYSNPDRVEQVLVTLMDNAVKHGDENGIIRLGMDDGGDKWQIYVENPAEVQREDIEHLFERFYKADTAHTGEGTGLGLAIAQEVLHLMNEDIRVDYNDGMIRFTFTVAKKRV